MDEDDDELEEERRCDCCNMLRLGECGCFGWCVFCGRCELHCECFFYGPDPEE